MNIIRYIYYIILKILLLIPYVKYSSFIFKHLGVKGMKFRISPDIKIIGKYSIIQLEENVEINAGCFLLSTNKILIGKNSCLAYQTTILTGSNPNGPKNLLYKIYGNISKPVIIGDDTWIGSRSVILP